MAFSFGFSGDDIDIDESEINNNTQDAPITQGTNKDLPELIKASKHDMSEWVSEIASGTNQALQYTATLKLKPMSNSMTALNFTITSIIQSPRDP